MEHRWRTECIGPRDIDVPVVLIGTVWTCGWGKLASARYKMSCNVPVVKTEEVKERAERENEPVPIPSRDGFVVVVVVVCIYI